MTNDQSPTFESVLGGAISAAVGKLPQCLPAKVLSYNASKHAVTAQPYIARGYINADGARAVEKLPPVTNVPVMFPSSGGAVIKWTVKPGDTVWLIFSSTSLDKWLVRGGEVDPEDDRHHDYNDCVAFPGASDFAHVGDAPVQIEITPTEILAGGNQQLVTKADFQAFIEQYKLHTHPVPGGTSSAITPTPVIQNAGTQILKGA